jgi:hypothetical protein
MQTGLLRFGLTRRAALPPHSAERVRLSIECLMIWRRSLQLVLKLSGKAEPYRTEGGKAASESWMIRLNNY